MFRRYPISKGQAALIQKYIGNEEKNDTNFDGVNTSGIVLIIQIESGNMKLLI